MMMMMMMIIIIIIIKVRFYINFNINKRISAKGVESDGG